MINKTKTLKEFKLNSLDGQFGEVEEFSGARRSPNIMNDSILVADEVESSVPCGATQPAKRLFFRLPMERINWVTSAFLIGTFVLTFTAVPAYLWFFGLDWFQVALFFTMLMACGFSVTLGYHRLFSHMTFQAAWPIRLFALIFGAGAFENSVLMWASEHRRHHKHVDHEEDPYCISKGFFFAHIGWLLFKLDNDEPYDNVHDLQKDKLVCWQDRNVHLIAVVVSFVFPAVLGFLWNGWIGALGAFLLSGVARIVVLQHCTFLINSACHTIGRQPYSTKCSARDSFLLAIFTFGEGYHNYHHEFQYDYRNGVKPWQMDPTKWIIWTLSKTGLVSGLRRAAEHKIFTAEQATRAAPRNARSSSLPIPVQPAVTRSCQSPLYPIPSERKTLEVTFVQKEGQINN